MKVFNLPNILTMLRILMIPIFVYVFFLPVKYNMIYAAGIYILAAITDMLDGYIARKYNLITDFGKVFDPLADKLLQLISVGCLVYADILPVWFLAFYIVKETCQIFAAGYFLKNKIVVSANIFGKIASVLFYISTVAFILFEMHIILKYIIMLTVVTFSLIAMIKYMIEYVFKNKK